MGFHGRTRANVSVRSARGGDNLSRALDSRAVLDQAIGVLMATQGLSAEQAFSDMARQSQNTNTKLRDIAGRITDQARRSR